MDCIDFGLAARLKTNGSIRSRTIRLKVPGAFAPLKRAPYSTTRSTRGRRTASYLARAASTSGVSRRLFARTTASSNAIEAPCPEADSEDDGPFSPTRAVPTGLQDQ